MYEICYTIVVACLTCSFISNPLLVMMTNEYLYTITQFVIEMYKWPTVCEYDKDQYVRYIYYILSHFNYIIMCNVLNHHMSWFTKAISISISIPVIYNRLIKETYKLYNTIENIILNRVAYIVVCSLPIRSQNKRD
jgi:hypothetical protein